MTATLNYETANIFGSYIMNMRRVPGAEFHNEKEEKRKEKELFETIDDYVEQA